MRILGLVEHPEHVCCRYRLAAFREGLATAGHQLELRAIPEGFLQRLQCWWGLRHYDLVILQRRLLSSFHLLLLRRYARRLIFDFDDAVYQRDSYAGKSELSFVRQRRFAATVQAADLVVAGNDFLREQAARYCSLSRIHVMPTCVDPDPYPLARHLPGERVRLVWIGSSSTLQGLEQQRALWDRIAEEVPNVVFKVICDRFPEFSRMPILPIPWAEASEGAELADGEIGVSWLPDDRWSQGKCGLKVLQYMAAGLPVVANEVGVQPIMVRHGQSGFLANTPTEWIEAIKTLSQSPELRQRFGATGRHLVEDQYSTQRGVERWLDLLARLGQGSTPCRSQAA